MDHPVIHFEIPANNVEQQKKFYSELFGWKIQSAGFAGYQMIETKAGDGPGINGGLFQKHDPQMTHVNYVMVESVDDYAAKVKQLGGQVVRDKTAIPKMGYFAICLDPEGNAVGLWEDNPNAA